MLRLCEGPTQGLNYIPLKAEAEYLTTFTQSRKRFVLILHYNGNNCLIFANATKIY